MGSIELPNDVERSDDIYVMDEIPQECSSESGEDLNIVLDKNGVAQIKESIQEAEYFVATSMTSLTPASLAAIARLRAYNSRPFPVWDRLPMSRRAAVLILLFAGRRGELRVVITMRASTLRSFSGQAALPGGKADTLEETPFEMARREAWEEIGLPNDDSKIPKPFRIEHLCQLPFSLAKTELAVRPCVAFLHSDDASSNNPASVEDNMIPQLDAKEVAAVFSAPLHNFLRKEDEVPEGVNVPGKKSDWYDGQWTDWHSCRWRMHNFHVPINNQKVSKPKVREDGQEAFAEVPEKLEDEPERYLVWGMTARILVDAARVAFGEDPEFEFNAHIGDEETITKLHKQGMLKEKTGAADVSIRKAVQATQESSSKI